MKIKNEESYKKGTYGFDRFFLKKHEPGVIELFDNKTGAGIIISPELQGRVMTSTSAGLSGKSYGWINYNLFEKKETNEQFNPYGGEERFWIGPEGGPFSFYFKQGEEQVFSNWKVPGIIDREKFNLADKSNSYAKFIKEGKLVNASGFEFDIEIEREITILEKSEIETLLKKNLPEGVSFVAYKSKNSITNRGENEWKKDSGLLSVWMLCMFSPSPSTTVFIPFNPKGEGVFVNDEYFGKVPSERLIVEDSTLFFKIDGNYRSKIGIPFERAKAFCGSYDSKDQVLTIVSCSLPKNKASYVNSNWGKQVDAYNGDVINTYNDGPQEEGTLLGPFYEIETSSPGAELQPGKTITHIQNVIHIQGDKSSLANIVEEFFNLNLKEIESKF